MLPEEAMSFESHNMEVAVECARVAASLWLCILVQDAFKRCF